jgi:hypothetical protein
VAKDVRGRPIRRRDENAGIRPGRALVWFGPAGPTQATNGTVQLTFEPATTPLMTDYDDFHPRSTGSGKNVVFMDNHVTALLLSDIP